MYTIADFVKDYAVGCDVVKVKVNPNLVGDDGWTANNFRVALTLGTKKFVTFFSHGSGIKEDPTANSILECLALDSNSIEGTDGFEDWASAYGVDEDSRMAEKNYNIMVLQAQKLKEWLGEKLYKVLLDIEF